MIWPGDNRFGEINIGIWVRGDLAGHDRKGAHQIAHIYGAKNGVCGLRELDHDNSAARFSHPEGFGERRFGICGIS